MATKKEVIANATKAINEKKLQEFIQTKVKSIASVKAKGNPEPKEVKPKVKKETPIVENKTVKTKKEKAVTKEATIINKTNLIEKVISNREVKYIYPEDCNDTLSRKSWRQKVRARLHSLEMAVYRIKDQGSKEFKEAKAEYDKYQRSVCKIDVAV